MLANTIISECEQELKLFPINPSKQDNTSTRCFHLNSKIGNYPPDWTPVSQSTFCPWLIRDKGLGMNWPSVMYLHLARPQIWWCDVITMRHLCDIIIMR